MYEKNKTKWEIQDLDYRWYDKDYFGQQLFNCSMSVSSSWVKKTNSYRLKYNNKKEIVVERIKFKDSSKAEILYSKLFDYTKLMRNIKRNDDWRICGEIREWKFHYTVLKGTDLYIIGSVVGDFKFKSGEDSLESDLSNLYEAKQVYEYLNGS
jgi:hypothetical protein